MEAKPVDLAGGSWRHPRWVPLLWPRIFLERGAVDPDATERRLAAAGWPVAWRNDIYAYHHYHGSCHELLVVLGGQATVLLGGPGGASVMLTSGDAVLLPAGTGHARVDETAHFLVAGAYPRAVQLDIQRAAPGPALAAQIAAVPRPATDPVAGPGGVIARHWR